MSQEVPYFRFFENGFPGLKVDDPLPSPERATRAAMVKNSCGRRRLSSELVFGVQISEPKHCRTPRSQNKLVFVRNLLCENVSSFAWFGSSKTDCSLKDMEVHRPVIQNESHDICPAICEVFGLTQQYASGAQRISHMAIVRCYVVVPCSSLLVICCIY